MTVDLFSLSEFGPPVNDMDVRARTFLMENPHLFDIMVGIVTGLVPDQTRFTIDLITELLRYEARKTGIEAKFTNSYRPHFGRLLYRHLPEARPYLKGNYDAEPIPQDVGEF